MKWNWGTKLAIIFTVFASFLLFLVYKCVNTKYELVSKEYYKDELRYQDKIDGQANSNLVSDVKVDQNSSILTISFPKEQKGKKADGELWFYCQTNEDKDRKIPVLIDTAGQQSIDKNTLAKGNFKLKITWTISNKKYYSEKDVIIN